MPKIPLYNQGQGATTRMATGALSPRANVGAFTAPGQAQARLASQMQKQEESKTNILLNSVVSLLSTIEKTNKQTLQNIEMISKSFLIKS